MGMSGQHHAQAALYPRGKDPPVPIVQEAGWAPEPVWTQRLEEKSSASVGDWIPIAQPVVRHYTTWATAAPKRICTFVKKKIVCRWSQSSSIWVSHKANSLDRCSVVTDGVTSSFRAICAKNKEQGTRNNKTARPKSGVSWSLLLLNSQSVTGVVSLSGTVMWSPTVVPTNKNSSFKLLGTGNDVL
jgi:hypothetical protein